MIIKTIEEFSSFFNQGKSLIAIDYGIKKLGIAISTPDHKIAMPFKLITEDNAKRKIDILVNLIKEQNICAIVIGIPYHMDGSSSEQTLVVQKFIKKLSNQIDLPIFLQDERLTTKAANVFLKNFGLNRKRRNMQDDLVAASMILETVLESACRI